LDRPLSLWWCALGWLVAAGLFVGLMQLLGGLSRGDNPESVYATWAIAHGDLSCSYPVSSVQGHPLIAPLYPLLSGALAWVARIGHGVAFPTPAALGPHCAAAVAAISSWSTRSGALAPTIRLGYLSWLVLMAGTVALLRASGRGRCGWEPLVLVIVGCIPPVFMSVQSSFHPEGFVVMGLILGALACVRRDSWAWAGVLLGLAVLCQQFALLAAVPLVVVAPPHRRLRFAGAALGVAALVAVPLIVVTSGRVVRAVAGIGVTLSSGNTVVSEAHLRGAGLFTLSRVLPVVAAVALAWWAARRLGRSVLDPAPLFSLVATSLAFRLVFEVNLFGYYFLAVAALLLIADVVRGRVRPYLVIWIAMVTLVFPPLPWGNDVWGQALPTWGWQIVLVTAALVLSAGPLLSLRSSRATPSGQGSAKRRLDPADVPVLVDEHLDVAVAEPREIAPEQVGLLASELE
jgi:hypothetical protein